MESLLSQWDGEELIIRFDRPTGAWIIIAIHSTRLGPPGGGTRMKSYPDLQAAIRDALRLSEGMTYKYAAVNFAHGGAKAVIAVPPQLNASERGGLLRRYGQLVRDLKGLFTTGPDVGTSTPDMDIISETGAPYVFCRSTEVGGAGDPGPETALGVFHGIRVSCRHVFGEENLNGRRILVQGLGDVGAPLARMLKRSGARVLVSDVDESRVRAIRDEGGVESVGHAEVYDVSCDVFAPCALGGVLNRETIPRLRCRVVAGSANNQLEGPENADELQQRGILYAPDFVINSGGIIAIWGMEGIGWSRSEAEAQIVHLVSRTLERIFSVAESEGVTTDQAARRLAESRLSAAVSAPAASHA
jgi:leucine dehydrogenase